MTSYWDEADDPDAVELEPPVCNQMMLGDMLLPGIVELPEGKIGRKLDTKNAAGLEGATQTWQGYEPPEIKVVVRMWRAAHRRIWRRILVQIQPRPGKPPANPFTVVHDVLLDYGISQVLVVDVSLPKRGKTHGEVEVELTLAQYMVPKKTGTTTPKKIVSAPATVHGSKGGYAPEGAKPGSGVGPVGGYNPNVIGPMPGPKDPAEFNPQPPGK